MQVGYEKIAIFNQYIALSRVYLYLVFIARQHVARQHSNADM